MDLIKSTLLILATLFSTIAKEVYIKDTSSGENVSFSNEDDHTVIASKTVGTDDTNSPTVQSHTTSTSSTLATFTTKKFDPSTKTIQSRESTTAPTQLRTTNVISKLKHKTTSNAPNSQKEHHIQLSVHDNDRPLEEHSSNIVNQKTKRAVEEGVLTSTKKSNRTQKPEKQKDKPCQDRQPKGSPSGKENIDQIGAESNLIGQNVTAPQSQANETKTFQPDISTASTVGPNNINHTTKVPQLTRNDSLVISNATAGPFKKSFKHKLKSFLTNQKTTATLGLLGVIGCGMYLFLSVK